MVGYFFPLTAEESQECGKYGYPFIKENKTRWVAVDYEESSIDMGIITAPRFVLKDVVYDVTRQYFVMEATALSRVIVGRVVPTSTENPAPAVEKPAVETPGETTA